MKIFTAHPRSVGESYFEHMHTALWFSGKLLSATFCCLVHAAFPFLFERTGSRIITELHDRMVTNRNRPSREEAGAAAETAVR